MAKETRETLTFDSFIGRKISRSIVGTSFSILDKKDLADYMVKKSTSGDDVHSYKAKIIAFVLVEEEKKETKVTPLAEIKLKMFRDYLSRMNILYYSFISADKSRDYEDEISQCFNVISALYSECEISIINYLKRNVLGELYKNEITNLEIKKDTIKELEANKKNLIDQLQGHGIDKKNLDNQIQRLGADKKNLDDQIQVSKTDNKSLNDQLQVSKTDNKSLNDQIQVSKTDNKELDVQLQVSKTDNKSLDDQIQRHKADNKNLDDQLQKDQTDNKRLVSQLQVSKTKIADLQKELGTAGIKKAEKSYTKEATELMWLSMIWATISLMILGASGVAIIILLPKLGTSASFDASFFSTLAAKLFIFGLIVSFNLFVIKITKSFFHQRAICSHKAVAFGSMFHLIKALDSASLRDRLLKAAAGYIYSPLDTGMIGKLEKPAPDSPAETLDKAKEIFAKAAMKNT